MQRDYSVRRVYNALRTVSRTALIILSLIGCRTPAIHAQSTTGAACPGDAWSKPTTLVTGSGQPVYVESPSGFTQTSHGITLLGDPTYVWASRDTFFDRANPLRGKVMARSRADLPIGVLWDGVATVNEIVRPPATGLTLSIRAVPAGSGNVEAIWGTSQDTLHAFPDADAIWHATFDGTRWSAPTRVFTADDLRWGKTQAAVIRSDSTVIIAAPAATNDPGWWGVVVGRYSRGRWTTTQIPTDVGPPSNAMLAGDTRTGTLLLYANFSKASDGAFEFGFFAISSTDGGASWGRPRLVKNVPKDIRWPKLIRTADGRTRLFWVVEATAPGASAELHQAVTVDGDHWSDGPSLRFPTELVDYTAVSDRAGRVHVIARRVDDYEMVEAMLEREIWSSPERLSFAPALSMPSLEVLGDTLYLAFGIDASPKGRGSRTPALQVARKTLGCANRK